MAFQELTTLRSAGTGEHWITPVGIPVPWQHAVSAARASKLVARYPNNSGGTLYPIQSEQHRMRRDGNLQYTVGHLKLPVGYVANEKVGIGYSDTFTQPTAPSWTAVEDDLVVELDVFEPRIHYIAMPNSDQGGWNDTNRPELYSGDVLTLTISDNQGADLVYAMEWNVGGFIPLGTQRNVHPYRQWCNALMQRISQDPSGRYTCVDRNPVKPQRWNRPDNGGYFDTFARWSVSNCERRMGRKMTKLVGRPPRVNNSDLTEWPSAGFYLWPRNRPGSDHDNYTVSFSITRNGTALPVANGGTIANTWRTLAYKSETAPFTVGSGLGHYAVGATSGAIGRIMAVVDNGTTGLLRLESVVGTFQDDEIITCEDGEGRTVAGSARVDGVLQYQTLTSSSGGSAKLWSIAQLSSGGTRVFVTDVTGSFNNGDTLTASGGGTTTQNAASYASTGSLYTNHNTVAQSGTITPINNAVARTKWTATFNAATPTLDSPWFSGHSVRQDERRMAPLNGVTPHPHLEVWFQVTKDAAGNIISRRVNVENAKYASAARDYWYDTTIKVGGVTQTDARHQHLFHTVRQGWSWRQAFPTAICDPADFMTARCIIPLVRYPTWNNYDHNAGKIRGKQSSIGGTFTIVNSTGATVPAYNEFERAQGDDPLYPICWDFSQSGGARGEMGEMNAWESSLWQGDLMQTFPLMEAMGSNGAAAQGFLHRDEQTADPEDSYLNRHIYLKWNHRPYSGAENTFSRHMPNKYLSVSSDQRYDLTGDGSVEDLRQSHSPSIGSTSLYLLRPEKWFFDLARAYSWHFLMFGYVDTAGGREPKTGGVAGDPDHVIGYNISNGNRTFARPAREIWKASFISNFEGCRQRTMWRRVAQDMADHATRMAERTIWGIANVRKSTTGNTWYSSNDLLPTRYLPGDFMVNWGTGGGYADSQTSSFSDIFKAGYIMLSALHAHGNNAADLSAFWERQISFSRLAHRLKNEVAGGPWWWALPGSVAGENPYMLGVSVWAPNSRDWYGRVGMYAASAATAPPAVADSTVPVWPDDSMDGLIALFNAADTDLKKHELGAGNLAVGSTDFTLAAWRQNWIYGGEAGYSMPLEYYFCILGIAEYGSEATEVSRAATLLNDFDAAVDLDTAASDNEGYSGLTAGQQATALAAARYSSIANW